MRLERETKESRKIMVVEAAAGKSMKKKREKK